MADITIYKDPSIDVVVIDGDPPVDQSAEVAALTAQVAVLTAEVSAVTAERDVAQAKILAALAALS